MNEDTVNVDIVNDTNSLSVNESESSAAGNGRKPFLSTLNRIYKVVLSVIIGLGVLSITGLCIGIRARILITNSMEPTILKNSLVLVDTKSEYESVDVGDVIAFRAKNTEVLHRVTGANEEGLVVEPENRSSKATVDKSMYVGKEIVSFPFIGGWLRWILGHTWVVVIAGIGLIVLGCLPERKQRSEKG